jgi:phage tail sheath protein FI
MYDIKDVRLKDRLANESINFISRDENGTYMLFDMLTNISEDSLFKKLSVRRMTNEVKRIIQNISKNVFFNINDQKMRHTIVQKINKELSRIGGIDQYDAICDERNNTDTDTNSGVLNVDLFIVPQNYIRVINLKINLSKNSINSIVELEV